MDEKAQLLTEHLSYERLCQLIDERRLYVAPPNDSLRTRIMELLPLEMRLQRTVAVLMKAVQTGYIRLYDDHMEWTLGTKTLLAYFLGRVFSDDYYTYDSVKEANVWKNGNRRFPATQLERLFAVRYLRETRKNRYLESLPENAELVNKLLL